MVGPARSSAVAPCPLCGARDAELAASYRYDAIWAGLEQAWSIEFPSDVVTDHSPADEATLYACGSCRLEYFSPLNPGDGTFYARLASRVPYEQDRWEFDLAAGLVVRGAAVIDFGAGNGAFLRRLRGRAGRLVGVEHYEDALAYLRAAGLEARDEGFESLARREEGTFDVACAFHLVEHLARIDDLLDPMARCVRPGGRLFVSTPNRDRVERGALEPLDCPPHHVSRWSAEQLAELAPRFGLELVRVRFEPPAYSAVVARHLARGRPLLDRLPAGAAQEWGSRVWRHARTGPRRHALAARGGAYERRGLYGHAMLAELRRP